MNRPRILAALTALGAVSVLGFASFGGRFAGAPAGASGGDGQEWTGKPDPSVKGRPGEVVVDLFHPDNQPGGDQAPEMPAPRRGGRAVVHLASMPKHLNYMTENSAVSRWIMHVVHDYLVFRDWVTWEETPVLATGWTTEDALVPKGSEGWDRTRLVYGKVTEDGDDYVVEPVSAGNPLKEKRRVPKKEVESVQRSTVVTFQLRDGVKWHDGHPFDSGDVYFSWQCYQNPEVDCEDSRAQLGLIVDAEVLGPRAIRFFYAKQNFLAIENFDSLQILPSHVYNLSDPDNEKYKKGVDPLGAEQGTFVNDNPHNLNWIGLGPYKVTEANDQYIEAQRTDHYFDPAHAGYLDTIRWRHIPNDDAAKQAVLNGELDYFDRLRTEDYFGKFCEEPAFTKSYYKGYFYRPQMQYWAWNTRRPVFKDARVRQALGRAMDWEEYLRTQGHGLGVRITACWPYTSPNYDHTLRPIPYDLEEAGDLLDEAGWYDRDGDGIRDKNGQPLRFEYLMTTGNKASETQALKFKENLEKIGVVMDIATRDWSAFIERCKSKDFDTFGMAWILDPENSPRQLWESYEGEEGKDRTSNYPGLKDPEVDALIDRIETELDRTARTELYHRLQKRLYEQQPYMWSYNVPIKFAMAKRIRNFRQYGLNPGYSLRDWYIVEPGK